MKKKKMNIIKKGILSFIIGTIALSVSTSTIEAYTNPSSSSIVVASGVNLNYDIVKDPKKLDEQIKMKYKTDEEVKAFKAQYKSIIDAMKENRNYNAYKLQEEADVIKGYAKIEEGVVVDASDFVSGKMVTAPGVFTGGFAEDSYATCEAMKNESKNRMDDYLDGDNKASTDDLVEVGESDNAKAKGNKSLIEMVGGINEGFIDPDDAQATSSDEVSGNGLLGVNCSQLGLLENMTRLYHPVNITHSDVIMNMVFGFQVLALSIAVLLIAVYGAYYATGNETSMDPFKFMIRVFLVFLAIYYLPYLAQDILNVNNMLVYWIGMEDISVDGSTIVAAGILSFVASSSTILMSLGAAISFGAGPAVLLIGAIVLLVVIIFFIKTVVTLLFWWYARFLMILFLVVIGPVFMVMMILPKTANYGSMWLKFFIGEVFTQTFMVIGFFFVENLFNKLGQFNKEMDFNIFGNVIILYASILLLSKIPDISKSLVGSNMGGVGWSDARNTGNLVSGFIQNGITAAASSMGQKALKNRVEGLASERDEAEKEKNKYDEGTPEFLAAREKLDSINDKITKVGNQQERVMNANRFAQDFRSGKLNFDNGGAMDRFNQTPRDEDALNDAKGDYKQALKDSEIDKLRAKENSKWLKDEANFKKSVENADNQVKNAKEALDAAKTPEDKIKAQEAYDNALKVQKDTKGAYDAAEKKWQEDIKDDSLLKDQAYLRRQAENKLMNSVDRALGTADFKNGLEKRIATGNEVDKLKALAKSELDEKKESANQMEDAKHSNVHSMDASREHLESRMPDLKRADVQPLASKIENATADFVKAKGDASATLMNEANSKNHALDKGTADSIINAQLQKSSLMSLPEVQGDESKLNPEQRAQYNEASNILNRQPQEVQDMAKQLATPVNAAQQNLTSAVQNFQSNSGLDSALVNRAVTGIQSGAAVATTIALPAVQSIISESINRGGSVDVEAIASEIQSSGVVSSDVAMEYANQIKTNVSQASSTIQSSISSAMANPSSTNPTELIQTLSDNYASAGVVDSGNQARVTMQSIASAAYDKEVGARTLKYMVDEGYTRNDAMNNAINEIGPVPNFTGDEIRQEVIVNTSTSGVSTGSFNQKVQSEIGHAFDSGIHNKPQFVNDSTIASEVALYTQSGAEQKFEAVSTAVQKAHAFSQFNNIPDSNKQQIHQIIKNEGSINESQKSGFREGIIRELSGHGLDAKDARVVADVYIDYSVENGLDSPINETLPGDFKNMIATRIVEVKQEYPNQKVNISKELKNYAGNNEALYRESVKYSEELIDAMEND